MMTGEGTGSRGRLWCLCPDNQQLAKLNQGRRRGLLCAIAHWRSGRGDFLGMDANMVHRPVCCIRFVYCNTVIVCNTLRAQDLQSGGAITLQDNYSTGAYAVVAQHTLHAASDTNLLSLRSVRHDARTACPIGALLLSPRCSPSNAAQFVRFRIITAPPQP